MTERYKSQNKMSLNQLGESEMEMWWESKCQSNSESWAKECRQLLEAGKDKKTDIPLKHLLGKWPAESWILGVQTSRTLKYEFVLFKPLSLCYFV